MRPLLLVTFVIATSVSSCFAVKCYACTAVGRGLDTCNDSFNVTGDRLPVPQIECGQMGCIKAKAQGQLANNMLRGCGSGTRNDVCAYQSTNSQSVETCYCSTDLCNFGNTSQPVLGFLALLIICSFFTRTFL